MVRRVIAPLLGVPPADLDLKAPLLQLGLSSIHAVELVFSLGTELGLRLPGTLAFKAPTAEAITDELLELFGASAASAQPASPVRRQLQPKEPIAVVGMAFRMPGGIVDDESLWQALLTGRDTAGKNLPTWRWNDEPHSGPGLGNFVRDIDKFDAWFFNISTSEARDMDPQQRLLLEVCWSALENAGVAPGGLGNSPTGVYVGMGAMDYIYDHTRDGGYAAMTGGALSIAVGRISYVLGLRGPNLAIDTACSASLTATHQAIRALRGGECNLALAGGVSCTYHRKEYFSMLGDMGAVASDGRSKSFDASADGYGRAEGAGILVLMRLSDAVAGGHTIRALANARSITMTSRGH